MEEKTVFAPGAVHSVEPNQEDLEKMNAEIRSALNAWKGATETGENETEKRHALEDLCYLMKKAQTDGAHLTLVIIRQGMRRADNLRLNQLACSTTGNSISFTTEQRHLGLPLQFDAYPDENTLYFYTETAEGERTDFASFGPEQVASVRV